MAPHKSLSWSRWVVRYGCARVNPGVRGRPGYSFPTLVFRGASGCQLGGEPPPPPRTFELVMRGSRGWGGGGENSPGSRAPPLLTPHVVITLTPCLVITFGECLVDVVRSTGQKRPSVERRNACTEGLTGRGEGGLAATAPMVQGVSGLVESSGE